MNIVIRNSSGQPIYEQIYSQIKQLILTNQVDENETLPSIRLLAKELRISVITTKRAYEELEREGYIYTVPGKGSFVAKKNSQLIYEENLKKIEEHLEEIIKLSKLCNLSSYDLVNMLKVLEE